MRRVAELRRELVRRDFPQLGHNVGATIDADGMRLPVWGKPVIIGRDNFIAVDEESGVECSGLLQAMIAYYCFTSDGSAPIGQWVSFSELPDGQFYVAAFQGYTGQRLAQTFGDDLGRFAAAAESAGGVPEPLADATFRYQVFPHVPLAAACWRGDEEFPSSYRLLFDASVSRHLPTDGCAILGSILTTRLCAEGR